MLGEGDEDSRVDILIVQMYLCVLLLLIALFCSSFSMLRLAPWEFLPTFCIDPSFPVVCSNAISCMSNSSSAGTLPRK